MPRRPVATLRLVTNDGAATQPSTAELIAAMAAPGLLIEQPAVSAMLERKIAAGDVRSGWIELLERTSPRAAPAPSLTLIEGGSDAA
jgi:hypothetical protein